MLNRYKVVFFFFKSFHFSILYQSVSPCTQNVKPFSSNKLLSANNFLKKKKKKLKKKKKPTTKHFDCSIQLFRFKFQARG